MKRSIDELVLTMIVPVTAAAAIALGTTSPPANAASPVVRIDASAVLSKFPSARGVGVDAPARLHIHVRFATDTPGAPLFTVQQAVVLFPDHTGTNGRLFPSCDAAQIRRFHGNIRRCPRGARIGEGTVLAQLAALGITATAHVTMFNSHHGRSITANVQTTVPAAINESFDAPLTRVHDRVYGEQITLRDPPQLQEVLPGVFVGVQDFDVTVSGAVRVRGVQQSFIAARRCPTHAAHSIFDFVEVATQRTVTVTSDTKIRCRTA
jgi:hypothetical protein